MSARPRPAAQARIFATQLACHAVGARGLPDLRRGLGQRDRDGRAGRVPDQGRRAATASQAFDSIVAQNYPPDVKVRDRSDEPLGAGARRPRDSDHRRPALLGQGCAEPLRRDRGRRGQAGERGVRGLVRHAARRHPEEHPPGRWWTRPPLSPPGNSRARPAGRDSLARCPESRPPVTATSGPRAPSPTRPCSPCRPSPASRSRTPRWARPCRPSATARSPRRWSRSRTRSRAGCRPPWTT